MRKGRTNVWPFLFMVALSVLLAAGAQRLSRGYPWGIDDGVKRLMTRAFAASGGSSITLENLTPPGGGARFFALPKPYADSVSGRATAIFPACFSALGGLFYSLLGAFGFYFLAALGGVFLIYFMDKEYLGSLDFRVRWWGMLILISVFAFYALTFWEHLLALLLLLPFYAIMLSPSARSFPWLGAGAGLGLAIALRPESALLLPIFILNQLGAGSSQPIFGMAKRPMQMKSLWAFFLGFFVSLALAALVERWLSGRWITPQISAYFALAFQPMGWLGRLSQVLVSLFQSPLGWWPYAAMLGGLAIMASCLRQFQVFVIGMPLLVIATLAWGLLSKGAYGMVAYSQGLFWSCSWLPLGWLKTSNGRRREDPLFIFGFGFLLLAYLCAPLRPGMHWGPRFLFPALLPLALRAATVIHERKSQKSYQAAAIIIGVAAIMSLLGSIQALSQRGAATAQVAAAIQASPSRTLIVDRWHIGADLEPLWGKKEILWVQGSGDFEEALILLQQQGIANGAWLQLEENLPAASWPVRATARTPLAQAAGWRGELLSFELLEANSALWGDVYLHAAGRRQEGGQIAEALHYLRQAAACRPDNADLHYVLAVCLGRLERYDEALVELRRALELNPRHRAAQDLLSRLRGE